MAKIDSLKVSQKIYHRWFVLLSYYIEKISSRIISSLPWTFFDIYGKCFIFPCDEEEIHWLTEKFIRDTPGLRSALKQKEYYWEISGKGDGLSDADRWINLYNMIIKQILPKQKEDIKKRFHIEYCPSEVKFRMEWGDDGELI